MGNLFLTVVCISREMKNLLKNASSCFGQQRIYFGSQSLQAAALIQFAVWYLHTLESPVSCLVRLFLDALGLCCYMQAISSCGAQDSHSSGFSCYRTWALGGTDSVGVSLPCGMWDRTHVPYIGRQILNHSTAREACLVPIDVMFFEPLF